MSAMAGVSCECTSASSPLERTLPICSLYLVTGLVELTFFCVRSNNASVSSVLLFFGWNFTPISVCSPVVGLNGSVPGAPVSRLGSNDVL